MSKPTKKATKSPSPIIQVFRNVKVLVDGNIATIEIDLTKRMGPSKSGKTIIVGSTSGNQDIGNGIKLGINCYTKE